MVRESFKPTGQREREREREKVGVRMKHLKSVGFKFQKLKDASVKTRQGSMPFALFFTSHITFP